MLEEYNYCLRCGRKLKSKENRIRGYGNTCYKKVKGTTSKLLFETDVNKICLTNLKNETLINDSKFRLGIITQEQYEKIGKRITSELTTLENEILKEENQ